MSISIVIVNWNSRELLRKCLRSLETHCSDLQPEIIVVDAGSFDGCGEMLAKEFPEVKFVQSAVNIGFGRSNNLGVERATGEVLLLLNPDTEVRPGAVQAMLATLQCAPKAGIIGARQINPDGSVQLSSIHRLPRPINTAFGTERSHRGYWRSSGAMDARRPVRVQAVSGACMMLRAEVFWRAGAFNPDYFMYAEDMDLCLKIRRTGLSIYHVPAAEVVHHGGGSSRNRFSKFSVVMMRQALHRYMRLNHGRCSAAAYRSLMGASAVARLLLLAPAQAWATGQRREARRTSILKWFAILSWSLGMERWVREYERLETAVSQSEGMHPNESRENHCGKAF